MLDVDALIGKEIICGMIYFCLLMMVMCILKSWFGMFFCCYLYSYHFIIHYIYLSFLIIFISLKVTISISL